MTADVDKHTVAAGEVRGDDGKPYLVLHQRKGVPGNGLNWLHYITVTRAAQTVVVGTPVPDPVSASFIFCILLELIPHVGSVIEKAVKGGTKEEETSGKRIRKPKYERIAHR